MQDSDLDDLFGQARAARPEPSADLMARILVDAEQHQPVAHVRSPTVGRGFWQAALAMIGGGGALAGLSTATLAGLWIGFAQPAPVSMLTDVIWADETMDTVELIPSFDDILIEG